MNTLRMIALGSAVVSASNIGGWDFKNSTGSGDVVYTTEVVTALTTYCPSPTTLHHGNKTYTVTAPTTLTITDCPCTVSKPVKTPAIVYTTETVTAITTYCPAPTTITQGNKTYSVSTPTTLTITDCPCTVVKPVQPTGAPGGDECVKNCQTTYDQCRVKPDANMSSCAAAFAGCLGYNPFVDGSLVTPTACSAGATAVPTQPGSNPIGTQPAGTPTGNPISPPAVTAGAGAIIPAKALLALGAIALL
ncbi:hypothetical protein NOR_05316 [Metarhizium rileyi]|uniref:Uncharacterized protein n=1 Tax=Metarhizium rileyi (strain RCEF 4871) TaxID=1649241 RepID=A0A162JAY8_METRR|nr:hypothetical protein NOR_05316 [Metarhizium rileyi RCEF 4871]TWU70973.1 hypothetical protein ED733_001770 [Metarhizium rileyi]